MRRPRNSTRRHGVNGGRTEGITRRRAPPAGVAGRVLMAAPRIRGETKPADPHVHSKVTIVDDRYLRLGSANLCHRSMGADTECDLSVSTGDDEAARDGDEAEHWVVDLDEEAVDHPGVVVRAPRRLGFGTERPRAGVPAGGRQVDRGAVQLELRVRDRPVLLVPRVPVLTEAEGPAEPLDRRRRVLVADERDDALRHHSPSASQPSSVLRSCWRKRPA